MLEHALSAYVDTMISMIIIFRIALSLTKAETTSAVSDADHTNRLNLGNFELVSKLPKLWPKSPNWVTPLDVVRVDEVDVAGVQ